MILIGYQYSNGIIQKIKFSSIPVQYDTAMVSCTDRVSMNSNVDIMHKIKKEKVG